MATPEQEQGQLCFTRQFSVDFLHLYKKKYRVFYLLVIVFRFIKDVRERYYLIKYRTTISCKKFLGVRGTGTVPVPESTST